MSMHSVVHVREDVLWEDDPAACVCYVYCFLEKDFIIFESVEYDIWKELIKGSRTKQNIVDAVKGAYAIESIDVLADINDFLTILLKKGIVYFFD